MTNNPWQKYGQKCNFCLFNPHSLISMFQWQNMLCLFCFFINIDTGGEGENKSEWIYAAGKYGNLQSVTTDCRFPYFFIPNSPFKCQRWVHTLKISLLSVLDLWRSAKIIIKIWLAIVFYTPPQSLCLACEHLGLTTKDWTFKCQRANICDGKSHLLSVLDP